MSAAVRETLGGKVVLVMLLVLVILVGGGYAAAAVAAGDKVPRGTTIAGVDVGGLSPSEAAAALEAGLSERIDDPIEVSVDGEPRTVKPEEAGLSVDYDASVSAAGGEKSWQPGRLWDYYTGGDDLDPVVVVDEDAMTAAVDELVGSTGSLPRDGDVTFRGGAVEVVEPRAGEQVSAEEARAALESAYLQDDEAAELTLSPAQPDIDDADVQKALDDFANPAVSAPVTLVFGDSPVRLTPRQFGPALAMKAEDGALVPELKTEKLTRLVEDSVSKDGKPVDARFRVVGRKVKVVPDKPGVSYQPDDVTATFLELVTKPSGERQQRVKGTAARADFTTEDAKALKIKERVSTFTTYFPYAEYRNVNIGRAAELVDGTVLDPDETFSLNGTVGERTVENGFTTGFVISDGIFKEDLGGGVSQMATTMFNAMFFAGLEDIEHKPHSFYIDRYPVGRESTVVWGAHDLRFQNDTPYGVLIKAHLTPSTPSSQGVLTVDMYSTKYWDITTSTSDRYNYVEEKTRTLRTPDCYPNDGYAGFDVDVTRFFRRPGSSELVRSEQFHTTYIPSDTVVCKPPKNR